MSTFIIQEPPVCKDDKDIIRFVSIKKDKKKIIYYIKKDHVSYHNQQQKISILPSTIDLPDDEYCLGSELDLELELLDMELQSESDETIPSYKDSEWWDYIWKNMNSTCEEKLVWTF